MEDLDDPPAVGVAELDGSVGGPEPTLEQQGRARVAKLVQVEVAAALGTPGRGDRAATGS
ncbi:MAG TPA: hypothetical protein VMU39_29690 [Solirubrobacteraceae bacterium]|nr:hypothetical protein [Solirubrobacteraceae bacterium]